MSHLRAFPSTVTFGLVLAFLFAAAPASATVLLDGSETKLLVGSSIRAVSESATTLDTAFGSLKCEESNLEASTTTSGGSGTSVKAIVENFSRSKCNTPHTMLAYGTLAIEWTSGNNGILYSTNTQLTVEYAGLHCIFKTNVTRLGTITGSATTKGSATLDIDATIPRDGGKGGALCGSAAQWTGSYEFTVPSTLNVAEEASPPIKGTMLTSGSGSQLKTGTLITSESEAVTTLHSQNGAIECANSHIGGKTTNNGGEGVKVDIKVEAFTLSGCNASITVLTHGTLSISASGSDNGTVTSTGTELTLEFKGFHCIYRTNNTSVGTITGSATTKGSATLDIAATIPRTGGSSGSSCGATIQWTGSYKITNPSALSIDDIIPAGSTTLTDGAGARRNAGTVVTAESEGPTTLHAPIGMLQCEESHIGGETANNGGGGADVTISLVSLIWSKCNDALTVLAKGSLSIKGTSGSNGTLYSTGTEVTREYLEFHCIFKTNGTQLGTITGSTTTKGNATLDISATIPRVGGSSGIFCGSTSQWTGSYKFTAPSTLNID